MFMKLAKHRKFEYTPRIYNPKKDDQNRPKIDFQSLKHRRRNKSFIWLLALLFLVVYLIITLSKISNNF